MFFTNDILSSGKVKHVTAKQNVYVSGSAGCGSYIKTRLWNIPRQYTSTSLQFPRNQGKAIIPPTDFTPPMYNSILPQHVLSKTAYSMSDKNKDSLREE